MAWPTPQKNNVIAGAFLLSTLLLAVLTSAVLSGLSFDRSSTYTARFDMRTGAQGVKPGSLVTVGGKESGEVTSVLFHTDDAGRPVGIDVVFSLDRSVALGSDAEVFLQKPLLGALSTLNIADVGDTSSPAGPDSPLAGRTSPPSFLADAGYGDDQADQLQRVLANADALTADLADVSNAWSASADPLAADVRAAAESLRASLERIEQRVPAWDDGITEAIDSTSQFAADLDKLGEDADARVAQAGEFIEDLTNRLDVTGPKIDAAASDAAALAAGVRDAFDREGPSLRRLMANLLVMSEQAALTVQEVRAEPWRVLFRPSTKELETQLLYDATRSLATSVTQLTDASAALAAADDPESAADIRAEIDAVREDLAAATERLFQQLEAAR